MGDAVVAGAHGKSPSPHYTRLFPSRHCHSFAPTAGADAVPFPFPGAPLIFKQAPSHSTPTSLTLL